MSFRTGRALAGDAAPTPGGPDDDELEPEGDAVAQAIGRELDFRPLLGGTLVLLGGLLGIVSLVVLGVALLGAAWLRQVWSARALRRLRIERRFEPDHVVCGDDAHLVLSVSNRKLLPLPWLRTEEPLPAELQPTTNELQPTSGGSRSTTSEPATAHGVGWTLGGRSLVNGWSIGPYQRVVRRIDLRTERRGVCRFGAISVSAGDLFGESVADEERSLRTSLVIRPRSVPVRRFDLSRDRPGMLRARHGLFEDPSRFSGVRPYAPSDGVRHIHWRTTARLGTPVVKRYEPSRQHDVVIALDIQTTAGTWVGRHDDDLVESLCVVAVSLARSLETSGAATGLAVAAFTGTTDRIAFLAPSQAEHQAGRIGELLARLSPYPSASFEHLLGRLGRMLRPGTLVIVVSARDPRPYLSIARRLAQSGFGLLHLATGPDAVRHSRRMRAVGLTGRIARLDSDWRSARTLDVAG